MVSTSLVWTTPPIVLVGGLDVYRQRILVGLHALADLFAARLGAYAKANAPWNDDTGEARAKLRGITLKAATSVVIQLASGAAHGIYLELGTSRMAPRPIIRPTLEAHYAPVMAALRALVGGG